MRGADTFTESLFTMRHLDDFVPADHPLRVIRIMVNKALASMDDLFGQMYAADIKGGRPSIAPEKLLRAMLIQVLYSVRSERQLMEQTQYNLLLRWFIGLAMDDAVWVPTVHDADHSQGVIGGHEVIEMAHGEQALGEGVRSAHVLLLYIVGGVAVIVVAGLASLGRRRYFSSLLMLVRSYK